VGCVGLDIDNERRVLSNVGRRTLNKLLVVVSGEVGCVDSTLTMSDGFFQMWGEEH
jgi:hypothetical protein